LQGPPGAAFRSRPAYQRDKPRLVFSRQGSGPVSPRLHRKGYLKAILHKSLPRFLYPPAMHTRPASYFIGISFMGKEQCLG
jgi:hypothetical protein